MGPVIEITGDTRVTRLQNFAQSRDCVLAIGRAFDNDIILDDPYIDPHHGQLLVSSTGGWTYQDLGSENGSKLGKQSVTDTAVQSTDVLVLGKTQLQLFNASHVVAPTLSLHNLRQRLLNFNSLATTTTVLSVSVVLLALNMYLNYTGEEIRIGGLVGILWVRSLCPSLSRPLGLCCRKSYGAARTFVAL